jgi:hypothetical protein
MCVGENTIANPGMAVTQQGCTVNMRRIRNKKNYGANARLYEFYALRLEK